MKLTSLLGNSQKLDGGAMFGNAPRVLWERWAPADDAHRIDLACRCLLVEIDGLHILLETGVGAFFEPTLRHRYGVQQPHHVLLAALAARGLDVDDIDIIVLSHLHFDHAGGVLAAYADGASPTLAFPRARFVVGADAWQRALQPHPRDRASFIPALQTLLSDSGRLCLVDGPRSDILPAAFRFHRSDGHTPGLLLTELATPAGPLLFASDLIPGVPWVHTAITMGYDRFPELLIDEKERLLADLVARGGWLFFTHDPATALGRVTRDERGRFGVAQAMAMIDGALPPLT